VSPTHFGALCYAEIVKLFSRTSARLGLVLLVLLAAAPPLAVFALKMAIKLFGSEDASMNGVPFDQILSLPAPMAMVWALTARNFFVAKAFLIVLGAQVFAAEYQAQTLREDLLRPVPRWAILLSRWLALDSWVVATGLFSWAAATLLGLVFFGGAGDWQAPSLGFFASILAECGFAAVVLAIAVVTRSVAFTIAGVFLFIVLDYSSGLLLAGARMLSAIQNEYTQTIARVADAIYPWMPFSAFGVWHGFKAGWSWQGFVALAVYSLLAMLVAQVVFRRIDVP
jgi:ABC-type transport system involved in multi-copper enzyme maturation permease subunit